MVEEPACLGSVDGSVAGARASVTVAPEPATAVAAEGAVVPPTGAARLDDVASPRRARPKDPARRAVQAHLSTHTRALLEQEDRVPWHAARIEAKKARYAAEACQPVFGRRAGALAAQLTRVTECLGEHQDAAIAAAAALALAAEPDTSAPAALGLGLLHGVQRDAVRAAREEFAGLWPEVSAKRWRSWL